MMRPPRDAKDPKAFDEASDTQDTIDWLLKAVKGNNGRVGMLGVSYPGWLAALCSGFTGPEVGAVGGRIIDPECEHLDHHRDAPIAELRSHQRAVGVSRIPWPIRPLFWFLSLNLFGRRRCHNFGTFSLSSIGSQGAGLLSIKPILTSAIHYGMLEKDHSLAVRLTWDHRVFDGATAARALTDLERILTVEMVREIEQPVRLVA